MTQSSLTTNPTTHTEFTPWVEKYRPKTLQDVIGHGNITERLIAYVSAKNVPHMLLAGPAGTGKTTSSIALAKDLFGESFQQSFLEMNASDERGIDIVRGKIKDFARTLPVSDVPFKIIFLDEADALTQDAQQALRRTMEKYSSNTRFILSCNYSGRIIEPIQSRCAVFRFTPLSKEDMIKLITMVEKNEGLTVDDKAKEAILYIAEGDARKVLNVLQGAASISKKITEESVYKLASKARPAEVNQMIKLAFTGNFTAARSALDKLMIEYGLSGEDIMSQVFQEVTRSTEIDDKTKVALVDKIGEYDFRLTEGANERIQLEALLAQFMLYKK